MYSAGEGRRWKRLRPRPQGCHRVGRGRRRWGASVGAPWKGLEERMVDLKVNEKRMCRRGPLGRGR